MTDNKKSRNTSFRKLFSGGFFFRSKSKDTKREPFSSNKNGVYKTSVSNQYQNPRPTVKSTQNNDCMYENLSTFQRVQPHPKGKNDATNNQSSISSTLLSESLKNNETVCARSNRDNNIQQLTLENRTESIGPPLAVQSQSQYPDVYYHSLQKVTADVLFLNEPSTKEQPHDQSDLTSVSAEIKKVSTKFLISPKKEAVVRTLQPSRAQSLSFDNRKKADSRIADLDHSSKKPYNYSAPTSPISPTHRIPNMPKIVSPYGHVRKTMIETEEKRNSLTRPSSQLKCSPSPEPSDLKIPSRTAITVVGELEKEKTRQKVEAFYWQKLKELKQKEDEYLLRQSINGPPAQVAYPSSCSTPNSYILEPRTCSLQRGINIDINSVKRAPTWHSSFNRDVPERRTDTFMFMKRSSYNESDVVYRHSEKSMPRNTFPIASGKPHKRASWEVQSLPRTTVSRGASATTHSNDDSHSTNSYSKLKTSDNHINLMKIPPRPPVRTTSVGSSEKIGKKYLRGVNKIYGGHNSLYSESECSSEAGEIQRILQTDLMNRTAQEDWHGDARIDGGLSDGEAGRGPRGRSSRRDDPRRHTLAGNHLYVHPHHNQHNSHDMERPYGQKFAPPAPMPPEYATVVKYRDRGRPSQAYSPYLSKPPLHRYPPQTNALLFDDDPGIMSEVETSSTGFRRGGKQRSSLPVVRTPSKTLERPLGLVFLQYRNETKRALLPNEITSIDTVKALFVRSFPKQLTMQYMDSPMVKIYIHDSSKDMFYELEDVRAHLRDIRDRSVLRLFEATDITGGVFPGAVGVGSLAMPPVAAACSGPSSWDQDQSYFSEPEIDSEYHHQHVHKSKVKAPAYYIGAGVGAGAASTLPRGGPVLRAYSPAAPPLPADRVKTVPAPPGHSGDGYMSSPERSGARVPYEEPYYTQFLGSSAGRPTIAPVIDEETSDSVIIDESYQMYGVNPLGTGPRPMPRTPYETRLNTQVDEIQRLRVEKMERQLANLTGLVQKALQTPGAPPAAAPRHEFSTYAVRPAPQDAARFTSIERPPKLGRDKFQKSVSFEKSVSFSDDPPDMNSPKQHSPQHSADTKPTKPAIKSSTLPRTSSQERDRLKPAPPPKPVGLVGQQLNMIAQRTYTINVLPDFFNQLRLLQKQSRDLRIETRNLRRSTLTHAIQMRQLMADTIVKIGALAATFCEHDPESQLAREEEIYRQDMLLLENDLYELEATVERLRGQAANRETRVNMADIERIAMVLSKSSKTVADWKLKFPILQNTMKVKLSSEMEKVVRKEKMLEEEPERLELALRRCKKLTGTLVTLKRLACVQEQRLPIADGRLSPGSSQSSTFTAGPSSEECASDSTCHPAQTHNKGTGAACVGRGPVRGAADVRPENALDALLDELQTFAKPAERGARGEGPLRRLHSYPSGSDTDASPPVRARGQHPPKPPVPERHPELLALAARRAPPPPPPRTTSRSPLASPTSPSSPLRADADRNNIGHTNEVLPNDDKARQALLEQRHQELLKKQKALQEQYARLQMIQRSGPTLPPSAQPDLKKTGSESNLMTKMNLNLAPAGLSGSLTHLASDGGKGGDCADKPRSQGTNNTDSISTTNKVYETDIL